MQKEIFMDHDHQSHETRNSNLMFNCILIGFLETKGAATDEPDLLTPRHISTPPFSEIGVRTLPVKSSLNYCGLK
jgi:hypothetical protein